MNKQIALAIALATASFGAAAGGVDYTYVEAGYTRLDVEGDEVGDGFQLRGSAAVAENIYLYGGYGRIEDSNSLSGVEVDESQLGVGLRSDLGERADFIAELGYVRNEAENDFGQSASADGGRLSVGLRGLLADRVEGWAKASYTDGGDFDGELSGVLGAQFKFNPTWGLIGEVELGEPADDIDSVRYLVGVRASF